MQAEFLKATKLDADEYENRQDFLTAVVEKVNTFKDPQWDKLSEDAQNWINDAIKKVKAKKRVPEFPDVGSVPADDDEDEAPKKKAKKPVVEDDDDEEEAPPKKKKKPVAEDDDDEEEAADDDEAEEADEDEDDEPAPKKKKKPVAEEDDDDEEPAPKKKKKVVAADDDDDEDEAPKKKKKAKPADDDDDEEDEKPAKKKAAKIEAKPTGVKVAIKTAIIENPEITVDALIKKLGKGGAPVSKVTVSNVRAEFRHTLRVLKDLGKLKGVDF
jgi:hypothetical protein